MIRLVGDFELAEEGLQDALAAALRQWDSEGIPGNPRAWLVRVGRNKAIDRARRAARHAHHGRSSEPGPTPSTDSGAVFQDDILRLMFTCCHPSLNLEAQVALTLRTISGLSTSAIARAFLVSEETMAQRLVRAKRKIRDTRIPYETPRPDRLNERLDSVLATIYLVFTEGYAEPPGEPARDRLSTEAIYLARLLDGLLPDRLEIQGLLALMLFHEARRESRFDGFGRIVLLEDQDRGQWDRPMIDEGLHLVELALRTRGLPHPYAIQAAIAALHCRAERAEDTDWRQIAGLYEVLLRLHPSPVVELNRAAAVGMVDGPARALDLLDALAARGELRQYHLLHAARADMLRRLGRWAAASDAYSIAAVHAAHEFERRFYEERIELVARQSVRPIHKPDS